LPDFVIFEAMHIEKTPAVLKEHALIESRHIQRNVSIDFYLPAPVARPEEISLLLINDGQDLEKLRMDSILEALHERGAVRPLLVAGIHAGARRKWEYGIAATPDYKGRGSDAAAYTRFVLEELLPFIRQRYLIRSFAETGFAGFSLGGLSALDIVWNHPDIFSIAGVFSGALWWRSKDKNDPDYSDQLHRLMHQQIRTGTYDSRLRFYFECGGAEEEDDRNGNGIIDSIDDTLDLIRELAGKGYHPDTNIHYLQLDDGKHDLATWARAMPSFLRWGWGRD
jgi:enterochelin esterase-like enzyme